LKSLDIADYDSASTDFYFIQHNALNNYQLVLRNSSNLYVEDLSSYIDSKNSLFVIYLVVSIVVCVLSFVCIAPIFSFVNQN